MNILNHACHKEYLMQNGVSVQSEHYIKMLFWSISLKEMAIAVIFHQKNVQFLIINSELDTRTTIKTGPSQLWYLILQPKII